MSIRVALLLWRSARNLASRRSSNLTPLTRTYLIDDLADVVIDQNARLTAEQSVIQLLGSIASSAPVIANRYIEPRLIFRENIPVQ